MKTVDTFAIQSVVSPCGQGVALHADQNAKGHFRTAAWFEGIRRRNNCTWMSWMDITVQGKFMSELTLTITVSTPSGKTYLKYWEKGQERVRGKKDQLLQREQLEHTQPFCCFLSTVHRRRQFPEQYTTVNETKKKADTLT